jgi:hypothetical protein
LRRTTAACGLALALTTAAGALHAQTPPAGPVAVLAINSYENLMKDADWLGTVVQMPMPASGAVEGFLAQVTGGKGLAGFDKTKPIGVTVDMSMMFPQVSAYLPVTDQSALLGALQGVGVTSQDFGNGVTQINAFGNDLYAKSAGGWLLAGMTPDSLGAMAADPLPVLGPLTQQYDVALQINVQNVPQPMRQQALAGMAAVQSTPKQPSESDEEYKLRQDLGAKQLATLTQLLQEIDRVNLGLAIAGDQQKVYLDVNFIALPGTALAADLTEAGKATTNFAGFANPAAGASLVFSRPVSAENFGQMEQAIQALQARLDAAIDADSHEEAKGPLREATRDLVAALLETLKSGKLDGGAMILTAPGSVTGVAGGMIADPAKLENGLKKLAEALPKVGKVDFPAITWNADKHGDFALHAMQVPCKDEDAKKIYGDNVDVVVALGGQAAYVAWGRNAAAVLKQTIDANAAKPGQATLPMHLTVSVGKFVEAMKDSVSGNDKMVLEMVSAMLSQAGGKDHVQMLAQPVDNGMQVRIELEQGVIQAIATSAMLGGGAGAPPPQAVPAGAGQ